MLRTGRDYADQLEAQAQKFEQRASMIATNNPQAAEADRLEAAKLRRQASDVRAAKLRPGVRTA